MLQCRRESVNGSAIVALTDVRQTIFQIDGPVTENAGRPTMPHGKYGYYQCQLLCGVGLLSTHKCMFEHRTREFTVGRAFEVVAIIAIQNSQTNLCHVKLKDRFRFQ